MWASLSNNCDLNLKHAALVLCWMWRRQHHQPHHRIEEWQVLPEAGAVCLMLIAWCWLLAFWQAGSLKAKAVDVPLLEWVAKKHITRKKNRFLAVAYSAFCQNQLLSFGSLLCGKMGPEMLLGQIHFSVEIMARVTKSKRIFAVTHISRHNTCRKAKESTACIKRKAGWNHYCHSRCFLSTVLWGMQCLMPKSSTVSSKDTCNHCTKL